MSVTSMGDPLVGRVLDDRYEILAKLARGGMATVYRGQDRRLRRTVAVKVMHDGLGDDAEFARKFDREARSAATLSNPHVVSVFDQGIDGARPYIVMEFVTGCTLRHVITREAPLAPLRALDRLESIASALASAHEAGLVHRDVKPENVLISDRGQVKVADFGLARAVSNQTATATQGLLIGTVSYLPPELVTSGRADARSDVYSAGVVLFEMLTGTKPHKGETPIQVAWSHVHHDIPAPSTLLAGNDPRSMDSRRIIPPYLDALVVACTRREPAERPHDGRELLELVRAARKALGHGILDDPALTARMTASVRRGEQQRREREAAQAPVSPVGEPTTQIFRTARAGAVVDEAPTQVQPAVPPAAPPAAPTAGGAHPMPPSHDVAAERRRRLIRRRRAFVTLLLTLLLALALGGGSYWYLSEGRYQATPALGAMTQSRAQQTASSTGLALVVHQEYSESVARGTVIRTQPAAGEKVRKDGQVEAWVSRGPERHIMPSVVGLNQQQAEQAIRDAGLEVGEVTQTWSGSVPAGIVATVSQPQGTVLRRSTAINLAISKGPQPVELSDWTGKDAASARSAMQSVGLTVRTSQQNSDDVSAGKVISQSPGAGQAHAGDTVNLVVSKGPDTVAVPDVSGKTEAQATAALRKAGFSVEVVHVMPEAMREDKVQVLRPGAGSQAKRGSTVTLWMI